MNRYGAISLASSREMAPPLPRTRSGRMLVRWGQGSADVFKGEPSMRYLKRWCYIVAVGVTVLVGLTNCIVVPAGPVRSGYVMPPPVVVVRPYRPYYGYGWYPRAYRW